MAVGGAGRRRAGATRAELHPAARLPLGRRAYVHRFRDDARRAGPRRRRLRGRAARRSSTHRLERAILEGVARRRGSVTLAPEMFERDAQPSLDDYLAGRMSEPEFLKVSRPWPNYATDYRPLVDSPARTSGARGGQRAAALREPGLEGRSRVLGDVTGGRAPPDRAPAKLPAGRLTSKRFAETMRSHPARRWPVPPEKGPRARPAPGPSASTRLSASGRDHGGVNCQRLRRSRAVAAVDRPLQRRVPQRLRTRHCLTYPAAPAAGAGQSRVIVPVDDLDQVKAEGYPKQGDYLESLPSRPRTHTTSQNNVPISPIRVYPRAMSPSKVSGARSAKAS